jgi:hypothetical protein
MGRTRHRFSPVPDRPDLFVFSIFRKGPRSAAIWRQLSEGIGVPTPREARVPRLCEVLIERAAPGGK